MNYHTTHDKGAHTPCQNLYNCRDSRVVSYVKVSASDAQNIAVKFVSDKFNRLSGNDTYMPKNWKRRTQLISIEETRLFKRTGCKFY